MSGEKPMAWYRLELIRRRYRLAAGYPLRDVREAELELKGAKRVLRVLGLSRDMQLVEEQVAAMSIAEVVNIGAKLIQRGKLALPYTDYDKRSATKIKGLPESM